MLGLEDCSSWLVFLAYILLFCNNSLLVTLTKASDNSYQYSTVLVVLLIELTKLIISVMIYLYNHSIVNLFRDLQSNKIAFLYYLVPSGLYCVFNNLVFLNLANFDPTTYTVLLQFSIVITGLIYQYLFKRDLSIAQWVSLFVLTTGCMISHLKASHSFVFEVADILILIQVLCSSFAGVYNEFLLKTFSGKLEFWLQNIVMYSDSCLCGVVFMTATGNLNRGSLSPSDLAAVLQQPLVLALVCTNVAGGLVTSMFLNKLNSILKKFAAAIEMVLLAILSGFLLGIEIHVQTVVSVLVVSISIIMYSLNPLTTTKEALTNTIKQGTDTNHSNDNEVAEETTQ